MMPIRDVVIFPHMMTPFVVGRESSIRALEDALAGDKKIFLATQHDAAVDDPKANEIYQVGTIANIVQSLKLPDGNIKVLVEGVERGKVQKVSTEEGYLRATVKTVTFRPVSTPSLEQLVQKVSALFEQYVKLSQSLNYETMIAAIKVDETGKLSDTVAANLNVSIEEKQELLEIFDPVDRLDSPGGHPGYRDREAECGPHHSGPRETSDGARPARVLPERKDQGHPEGIGPQRKERDRRAQEKD